MPEIKKTANNKNSIISHVIFLVTFIAIFFLLFLFFGSPKTKEYNPETWQAVFLDNGQVYFGHVSQMTQDSVVLQNIYYLQVVAQPLQRSQLEGEQQSGDQGLTLIKLGNEIHGPEDEMDINREHVVLIENLKDSSRVVNAIVDFEEKK